MIQWSEEGVILAVRRHGESAAIADVFTEGHGRHAGIVRGASSRKVAPVLQPGAQVAATWRARLDEHLGAFALEPVRSRAAVALSDRLALAGLNAVCALLAFCLPEREAHPPLYRATVALLDLLGTEDVWPLAYLRWEQGLLEDLGYGLDLSRCAVTGAEIGLVHVSPKTGRAVSAEGAGDWADRLLSLPPVLRGAGSASGEEVAGALAVTGHFLEHHVAPALGERPLPAARARLVAEVARSG